MTSTHNLEADDVTSEGPRRQLNKVFVDKRQTQIEHQEEWPQLTQINYVYGIIYIHNAHKKTKRKHQKTKNRRRGKSIGETKQNVLILLGVATAPTPVKVKSWEEIGIYPALG